MGVKHREIREYPDRTVADINIVAAAAACRFRVVEANPRFASLRCSISWWSFGENIEVHVAEVDGCLTIDVHSTCAVPTTIEDWGKNRKNVQRFFEVVEEQLRPEDCRIVPICAECGYALTGVQVDVCTECGAHIDPQPGKVAFRRKLRTVTIVLAAVTAIELSILVVLQQTGSLPLPLTPFKGVAGAVMLAAMNAVILFGMVLLARVWRADK